MLVIDSQERDAFVGVARDLLAEEPQFMAENPTLQDMSIEEKLAFLYDWAFGDAETARTEGRVT